MLRQLQRAALVMGTAMALGACQTECVTCGELDKDAKLLAEIASVNGRVAMGFKEAGAMRGVDERGTNLTSEATTIRMQQFVLQRGFVVTWLPTRQPAMVGRIPLDLALISELRRHPNVDYLEADLPGVYLSAGTQ